MLVVTAYPTIPESSSFAFMLIVLDDVSIPVISGFFLSIFCIVLLADAPKFTPSDKTAYIVPLVLNVCVVVLLHPLSGFLLVNN